MKKLPVDMQTFRDLRMGDYVYADKTEYIYNMLSVNKCYFLSRPRRFGKSLLTSTIAETFSGERELFRGLWLDASDYDFAFHPVIKLDMTAFVTSNAEMLELSAADVLREIAGHHGLAYDDISLNSVRLFSRLIRDLAEKYKARTVVLIDEYDCPILDHITNLEIAGENRDWLRSFYRVLKGMDEFIRFIFVTGITKFAKTSVFSGLNNLRDITLMPEYAGICGFTASEFEELFILPRWRATPPS